MGYTHYWYRPRILDATRFRDFRIDLEKVVRGSGIPLDNSALTDEGVMIDGRGEPFVIDQCFAGRIRQGNANRCFAFCKTQHLPYDALVTAALMLAKIHFGDAFDASSDGNEDPTSFDNGKALIKDILGLDVRTSFKEVVHEGDDFPSISLVVEYVKA